MATFISCTRLILTVVVLLLLTIGIKGQNLLPFEWSVITERCIERKKINILMSWERQGFSTLDGHCVLSNKFFTDNPSTHYQIQSRLQCKIDSLLINNVCIGRDISTEFWTDRSAFTSIDIPKDIVKRGTNEVRVFCKDLAWTGGHSHNSFIIREKECDESEYIKIIINKENHLFDSLPGKIDLEYSAIATSKLRLQMENSFRSKLLDTTINVPAGKDTISIGLGSMNNLPGFYQCIATLEDKYFSGDIEWIAVSPENLVSENLHAPDFTDYWQAAMAELADIQPDFKVIYSDRLSTPTKKAYIVEMQSVGNLTVRAYYYVPRTAGPHYAILHLPGYGDGFENISHLRNDATERVDMALCVRGHGLSADIFNPGFDVPGIWGYKLHEKDSIAYRQIYLDCVRAVDFLCSRPEVDKMRIGVAGGSQGGGLALATAALCRERIAACAYFDPFPCDISEHINIRTICRQQLEDYMNYYGNPCSLQDVLKIQSYIDARNFAPDISAKVLYATALFDDDCHPHVGFAAYNDIVSDKRYHIYPDDSHLGESDYFSYFMQWFDSVFSMDNDAEKH